MENALERFKALLGHSPVYPVTITPARYGGSYEPGSWLAFNLHFWHVDLGALVGGGILFDFAFGIPGVSWLIAETRGMNASRLRRRLKLTEREYRDAMAELGLG